MSNYGDDPINNLLNRKERTDKDPKAKPDDGDIQVINRDNQRYEDHREEPNPKNPTGNYLGDGYDNSNGYVHLPLSPSVQPLSIHQGQDMLSFSPVVPPGDYNQMTAYNQPKLFTSLPPLAPLSESVIPNGLNIQPTLNLSNKISEDKRFANSNRKRKENGGPKIKPAFVMKIWSMVNDPANHEYIRWNDNGKTFQVFHREEFMKLILPKYFKHNNFTSFVRQLNMYGWHKVQDISNGTLQRDDKNDEIWVFENPYFIRGREDLLNKIVRNKSMSHEPENMEGGGINMQLVLNELDQIKMNQLALGEDLRRIRKDNKTLWLEVYVSRERFQHQAQTMEKILKFLAAVYGNSAGKFLEGEPTSYGKEGIHSQVTPYNFQKANLEANSLPSNLMNPTTILTSRAPSPFNKPRLMLTDQEHINYPSNNPSPRSREPSGSIEEIIRSYEHTPSDQANAHRMYQLIVNHDPSVLSPKNFLTDLDVPGSFYQPNTPNQGGGTTPIESDLNNTNDAINGLEQSLYKQGQSIQQVQDWIQKLANQQQLQQQQIDQQYHQDLESPKFDQKNSHYKLNGEIPKLVPLDDFDVSQFLHSNTSDPALTDNSAELSNIEESSNKRKSEVSSPVEHSYPSKKNKV